MLLGLAAKGELEGARVPCLGICEPLLEVCLA